MNAAQGPDCGFTLIELMVVVLIIGILTSIAIPSVSYFRTKAVIAACNADVNTVKLAVAQYNTATGGNPVVTAALLLAPGSYLQSMPSGANYTISIASGVVMVAAPSTATAVDSGTPNACGNAGGSSTPGISAPTGVMAACSVPPPSSMSMTISWNAVANATSYSLNQSGTASGSGSNEIASYISPVTLTWVTLQRIGWAVNYFQVIAHVASAVGPGSAWAGPVYITGGACV